MRSSILAMCFGTATSLRAATEAHVNNTEVQDLEGGNLCMMGRLAPKFFLLGTPKSGTTFFFEDFSRSKQIVSYQPGPSEPDWHAKEPWVFYGQFDEKNKESWLSHYPKCTQDEHQVAIDCTPGYFGAEKTPFNLHKAYGDVKHSLVFMVFLRNPEVRSHSHYYQFLDNGVLDGAFGECQPQQFPKSFKDAVENRLTKQTVCDCSCDSIFEDSMYADSFRRYFKNFDASMFHVVPFTQAISGEAVEYAWQILNVAKGHGQKSNIVGGDNAENHHDYPTLEEDLSESVLKQYQNFMKNMAGSEVVASVLAGSGAHMYDTKGPWTSSSVPEIASWFEKYW